MVKKLCRRRPAAAGGAQAGKGAGDTHSVILAPRPLVAEGVQPHGGSGLQAVGGRRAFEAQRIEALDAVNDGVYSVSENKLVVISEREDAGFKITKTTIYTKQ